MAGERRRLAAILAADVMGYSRLVGLDEAGTVARVRALFREVAQPEVARAGGRVFKAVGDGFLAEFPSAVGAVACAAAIQAATEARAADDPEERRVRVRIAVHLGDVLVEGTDLFGDGVNVAARLEALADPGGVVLSAPVADAVRGRIAQALDDLGERSLKNIDRPVRVFRLSPASRAPETPGLSVPDRPSLVVLPFQNLSGDPEQEYFADGMVEDITTALSRIRWLFVIARNSAFTYKGRAVDVRQVGRELGVRYVLEGSVRKAGSRVRITGQLVEAETGRHVWADRFDGDFADVFEIQDRVTTAIATAIEPELRQAEIERASKKPTRDMSAYDLYLRSLRPFYQDCAEGYREALPLLEEAVARDPAFGGATAMLARAVARGVWQGWLEDHRAAMRHAEMLARRACSIAPTDPYVLAIAGYILALMLGELELGDELTTRAVAANPNLAEGWTSAGWVSVRLGESDRAIERFEKAERLDPLSPDLSHVWHGYGVAHFFAGRYPQAIGHLRRAIARSQSFPAPRTYLISALVAAGEVSEGACEAGELLRIQPNRSLHRTRETNFFRHPWMMELYIDGLRRAGIPD